VVVGQTHNLIKRMNTHQSPARRTANAVKGAFTLIELLVVIAIIAILAAMILPALAKAKQKGIMAVCLSGQKQLAMAWTMYADDHQNPVV
jgi:prepilin-type N-terminal cleavage/methylation domain-containing protein